MDERTAPPRPPEPGLRRRTPRREVHLDVECVAGRHRYAARTVDVSRDGVLLELLDARLRPPADAARLVELAASLERRFGNGFGVAFAHGVVRAQATLVRVELPRDPAQPFRVGCRFLEPLPAEEVRLLGLPAGGDGAS